MTRGRVTVQEYAAFAYDAYFETPQPTSPELPVGWKLFESCPESMKQYGYFGTSYIKINAEDNIIDLVIAHRGTNNLSGALEDARLWLTNRAPLQFQYGVKPFVSYVNNAINKQYPADEYHINRFITGHSLGATLAELTIADGEEMSLSGLSFESPGCVTVIEHMQQDGSLPKNALDYARSTDKSGNPITISIKARPDGINTFQPTPNSPVGPIPVPNIYPPNILGVLPIDPGYLDYTSYSFCVEHPMKHILDWINANDVSTLPVMLEPWPMGFIAGYQWYKSYVENKDYWDGYMQELWNNDGLLSTLIKTAFRNAYETFKDYYIDYFLYKTCDTHEQQNKARTFFEFIIRQQPKSATNALTTCEDLSALTNYLPDARIQANNTLNASSGINENNKHLASSLGLFKPIQTHENTSHAHSSTNSY